MMIDTDQLETKVRTLILELLLVLHRHGIREVSSGALMRMLGVPASEAAKYDSEDIAIDQEIFDEIVKHYDESSDVVIEINVPLGTTIH